MSSKRWRRIPSLPLQLFIITVLPLTALLLLIALLLLFANPFVQ